MMKASFKARRKWILDDNPSVTDILQKYSALKKKVYVSSKSYHFKKSMLFAAETRGDPCSSSTLPM